MTNSNHSNHLQFDCGHRIVQLCPLDLLLVVLDVLLLLVLFDLFTILVEPSQLEESNDDGEQKRMMENGNHCYVKKKCKEMHENFLSTTHLRRRLAPVRLAGDGHFCAL